MLKTFTTAILFALFASGFAHGGNYNWTNLGPEGGNIAVLMIDPTTPQTLYVGASGGMYNGLYKSTDGGNSWSVVFRGQGEDSRYALAIDPATPQTLYSGDYSDLSKSTDGGNHWSPVNTGLTGTEVRTLAISPTEPQILYAATRNQGVRSYSMPPLLEITMSKAAYGNGEAIIASEFRLKNLGTTKAVETKVWLEAPGMQPIGILNLGSDGSFIMPAGLDYDFGPLSLFVVTSAFSRGIYEFSSRMVNPSTGKTLGEDLNPFVIQ